MRVFNEDFYVHSDVLKLHSMFFRKFMDSPDKVVPVYTDPIKYDYKAAIDEVGTEGEVLRWFMIPAFEVCRCVLLFVKDYSITIYRSKSAFDLHEIDRSARTHSRQFSEAKNSVRG
jgi:hypothetical protein